jgi:hypothetical protein
MLNLGTAIGSAVWRLRSTFRSCFPLRWRRVGDHQPIAMIMLLRTPHPFSEQEIRLAAERAWGVAFAIGEGSRRSVFQSEKFVVLRAGPHVLSFYDSDKPFVDNPKRDIAWLANVSQQHAWIEHKAFTAVQYANSATDVELAHCVVAKVVVQLLDENCTGIYVPSESSLIPADDSLSESLNQMASFRDLGVAANS